MYRFIASMKKSAIEAVEASKPMCVTFGTVMQINPLKIQINAKETLDADDLILTDAVIDYQTELSFDDPEIKQKVTIREGYIKTKNGSIKASISAPAATHGTRSGAFAAPEANLSLIDPYANLNLTDDPKDTYKVDGYLRHLKDGGKPTRHKVTIYNALKKDEKVLLLRMQGGQQYVVLNRWRES